MTVKHQGPRAKQHPGYYLSASYTSCETISQVRIIFMNANKLKCINIGLEELKRYRHTSACLVFTLLAITYIPFK